MSPEQPLQPNPWHQPETISTASRQTFEDPEGGLALDSPLVQAREQERKKLGSQRGTPPGDDAGS